MTARESILKALHENDKPMTVDDLSAATGLLAGTVSSQLSPMYRAGLIDGQARRDGRNGTAWSVITGTIAAGMS